MWCAWTMPKNVSFFAGNFLLSRYNSHHLFRGALRKHGQASNRTEVGEVNVWNSHAPPSSLQGNAPQARTGANQPPPWQLQVPAIALPAAVAAAAPGRHSMAWSSTWPWSLLIRNRGMCGRPMCGWRYVRQADYRHGHFDLLHRLPLCMLPALACCTDMPTSAGELQECPLWPLH